MSSDKRTGSSLIKLTNGGNNKNLVAYWLSILPKLSLRSGAESDGLAVVLKSIIYMHACVSGQKIFDNFLQLSFTDSKLTWPSV